MPALIEAEVKKATPVKIEERVASLAKAAAALEGETLPEFLNRIALREAQAVLRRYSDQLGPESEPEKPRRPGPKGGKG